MGIAVLGPVRVGDGEALGPRDRVVLAALAARRGEPVTAEQLADALWGERPPASSTKVVQGCVVRLRKVLGPSAITTEPEGYRLALPVDEVDAGRFERQVQRGQELLTLGETERAAHVVGEALALWRGPALADLDGWSPGRIEAARLDELRLDAQELVLDAALRSGRYRYVLPEAQARVAEAPLRERRWALLARAQYQAGRQGEALRTLHLARTMLASELGVDPGPDLVALEAAILRQDPSLVADTALPEPSATCPYLGLVPYDVGDADAFFGRDADVAACLRRLADVGVLAVVGPSGSGKSSLVRAGVAAALGRDSRRVVMVTPGAHPTDALTMLPDGGPAPVLVVDQCEEAVTLCDDPGEQARFFAALAAHAERGPLVLALRADRLGELSAHPGFARLIDPGVYLLGAMGEADLRAAVEGPAHQAGLLLEPGLVELLVQDVEGEPGALPLLSHALRTTWERREGGTLTVDGYRASGGIRGAVAHSAEALYERVPDDQRPLLRDLLLRLVAPGPDGQPVRSRVPRRSVATDAAHEELIELLVGARLVTSDDGEVELAHEALARAWPRLQDWLDEDVEGQRILRHLTGAADTWDTAGRPDSELYRGARLAHALDWRDRAAPDLTPTEGAFLDASAALADAERRAAEDRARHQARQNRRLRALLTATAVFLVGALITGFVAVNQRDRAEDAGQVATARELAAAANANIDIDPERSILLALEAVERTRSGEGAALPEAEEALHRAVSASRIELRVAGVGGRLDWSPDGTRFAAEGPEGSGTVDIRDARTGELLRSVPGHDGDVNDVAFNHDGSLLATTGSDGAARIWDTATGAQLHSVELSDYPEAFGVWGPSFSPDGRLFAAAWPLAGVVKVLDLGTGQIRDFRPVVGPRNTSFDPSGARIAVSSTFDPLAVVLDTMSGEPLFTLRGHDSRLLDVDWSPDGTSLATASLDGTARVFDGRTGAHRLVLHGHEGGLFGLDWSPDGSRIVTASGDGTARVWQVTEGGARQMITLTAQDMRKGVTGVAFSSDGTRVMTGDLSSAATTIWDVSLYGDAEVANLPSVSVMAPEVAFTPDGRRLVTTSEGGSVTMWDAHDFTRVRTLGGPPGSSLSPAQRGSTLPPVTSLGEAFSIDVSRDGRLVAAARFDGTLRVWDVETGEEAFTVRAGPTFARERWMDVTWNRGGDLLAIATNDGTTGRVTIVDRAGREVAVLQEDHGIAVGAVAFSPNGEQLITTRLPTVESEPDDGQLVIWDWKERKVERAIDTPARHAVLSPTGDLIANDAPTQASYLSDTVHVWDAASGRRVSTLTGQSGGVLDLEFSPDESRLATASYDGTVWMWDPRSGEPIQVLRGHDGAVSSVAFSPDGSRLASVDTEGVVRVWTLDLDELVEIAEDELTRTVTDQECRQYLHRERCD